MPIIIIFIIFVIPFIEIATFIEIGGKIGAINTIILTIITGAVGIFLIKQQGLENISKIQNQINSDEFPFEGIFEGFIIMIAGFMLLIPGFITDIVGAVLFIPFTRKILYKISKNRQKEVIKEEYSSKHIFEINSNEEKTIDAEYKKLDEDK